MLTTKTNIKLYTYVHFISNCFGYFGFGYWSLEYLIPEGKSNLLHMWHFSSRHWLIVVMNMYFIHVGANGGLEFLSIYPSVCRCAFQSSLCSHLTITTSIWTQFRLKSIVSRCCCGLVVPIICQLKFVVPKLLFWSNSINSDNVNEFYYIGLPIYRIILLYTTITFL